MSRETLFGGAAGGGKALHIDSIIPTPSGFVPLHQLKCSDFVFGMDGRPTQILAMTPVMTGHQCWKLTFDDGSSVVADNNHIWLTYNAKELAQLTRLDPAWRANGSLRTTSQIASTLKTENGGFNHAIPIGELPDSSLSIDSYVLGCWLEISTRRTTRFRYITKCEMVPSVPVQCIQVAANDGMFLVGRTFIPTHNSSALLMAALQFVDIPDYAAIIFRLKHSDLALPGALMDRASDWLGGTDARWNGQEKTWRFPSGASLTFGYLDSANDRFRYQSAEFQFVGFDELTQFKETDYTYLFSRQRRLSGSKVPIRMRGATNPGGIGHAWVKKRFLTKQGVEAGRVFIPAKLEDNEHVDIKEYEQSLNQLDSFTRKQLRFGVWDDFQGGRFAPAAWPRYVNIGDAFTIMTGMSRRIIYHNECTIIIGVDWAVNKTKRRSAGQSPEWMTEGSSSSDFNSFVVCALSPDGLLFVLDCVNERIRMEDKAKALAEICHKYNPWIVAVDDDMLSEGLILECRRMRGIPELKVLPIGARDKLFRATPAIINAENKRIYLPTPIPNNDYAWMEEFIDQLTSFTGIDDEHDDIADALGIVARVADEVRGDGVEMDDPTILIGGRDVFNGGF